MKNSISLIVLLLTFSFNFFSQIEKNTWMIGGDLSFTNSHYNGTTSNNAELSFNPQVGYFFMKNFAVGLSGSIYHRKNSITSLYIAPALRYYFKNIYSQISFGVVHTDYNNTSVPSQIRTNLQGKLGYALFLNKNVALEPSVYFSQYFDDGKNDGSRYGLQIGLQIYLNR